MNIGVIGIGVLGKAYVKGFKKWGHKIVQYDIKGNPQLKQSSPKLRAYRIKLAFLVPDPDALEYIWNYREKKKKF